MKKDKKDIYEMGYHIVPLVAEDNLAEEVSKIKARIEKAGGSFVAEEFPKHFDLAYSMFKNISGRKHSFDHAYFGWLKFYLDIAAAQGLQKEMEAENNILRFIFFKTVAENTFSPYRELRERDRGEGDKNKSSDSKTPPKPVADSSPASQESLDKTIDELVIN